MNLRTWDTLIYGCKLCVRAQTVQQILKQPSEDVMAVSQNQAVKGRFCLHRGIQNVAHTQITWDTGTSWKKTLEKHTTVCKTWTCKCRICSIWVVSPPCYLQLVGWVRDICGKAPSSRQEREGKGSGWTSISLGETELPPAHLQSLIFTSRCKSGFGLWCTLLPGMVSNNHLLLNQCRSQFDAWSTCLQLCMLSL